MVAGLGHRALYAHAGQRRPEKEQSRLRSDKLDGKIDEEFWTRKMNEWREQERTLES